MFRKIETQTPVPPVGEGGWVDLEPGLAEQLRRFVAEHPEKLEPYGTKGRLCHRYWLTAPDGTGVELAAYSRSAKHDYLTPYEHSDATEEGVVLLLISWKESERGSYGGSCMSKGKVAATLRAILADTPPHPELAGAGDPDYRQRLETERLTLELQQKSRRAADGGKRPMEESPLFGGPAQGSLF